MCRRSKLLQLLVFFTLTVNGATFASSLSDTNRDVVFGDSNVATGSPQSATQSNQFARFFGEWGLKDNVWNQRHGQEPMQTINIQNHHTRCTPSNTQNSVLCVVTTPDLQGHILWTHNADTDTVHHLSNFTPARNGVGQGHLDENGNLSLTVQFQGEPDGTHRKYEYRWLSDHEYTLSSTQFQGKRETGNFYGGTFIKLDSAKEAPQ